MWTLCYVRGVFAFDIRRRNTKGHRKLLSSIVGIQLLRKQKTCLRFPGEKYLCSCHHFAIPMTRTRKTKMNEKRRNTTRFFRFRQFLTLTTKAAFLVRQHSIVLMINLIVKSERAFESMIVGSIAIVTLHLLRFFPMKVKRFFILLQMKFCERISNATFSEQFH